MRQRCHASHQAVTTRATSPAPVTCPDSHTRRSHRTRLRVRMATARRDEADRRADRVRTARNKGVRMRPAVFVLPLVALLLAAPALASDDESSGSQASVRPFVGAFLPTGDLHKVLESSILTGVQLGYPIGGGPARLVGTFAWAPSHANELADAKTNVYQYDVGGELATKYGSNWKLSPFVGAGVGARTYSMEHSQFNSQTDFAGYGA